MVFWDTWIVHNATKTPQVEFERNKEWKISNSVFPLFACHFIQEQEEIETFSENVMTQSQGTDVIEVKATNPAPKQPLTFAVRHRPELGVYSDPSRVGYPCNLAHCVLEQQKKTWKKIQTYPVLQARCTSWGNHCRRGCTRSGSRLFSGWGISRWPPSRERSQTVPWARGTSSTRNPRCWAPPRCSWLELMRHARVQDRDPTD